MGPAEASALLAYLQAATDAHNPAVSEEARVLLCAAAGWLREVVEGRAAAGPNPFRGWTFQPWMGADLWASKGGTSLIVGTTHAHGWIAWPPYGTDEMAHGPETGQAGRDAVAAALRSRGAKL
jgi:hypothetical protein